MYLGWLRMKINGWNWEKREGISRHLAGLFALENESKGNQISRSLTKIAFSVMNLNRGSESLPIKSSNTL